MRRTEDFHPNTRSRICSCNPHNSLRVIPHWIIQQKLAFLLALTVSLSTAVLLVHVHTSFQGISQMMCISLAGCTVALMSCKVQEVLTWGKRELHISTSLAISSFIMLSFSFIPTAAHFCVCKWASWLKQDLIFTFALFLSFSRCHECSPACFFPLPTFCGVRHRAVLWVLTFWVCDVFFLAA